MKVRSGHCPRQTTKFYSQIGQVISRVHEFLTIDTWIVCYTNKFMKILSTIQTVSNSNNTILTSYLILIKRYNS